MAAPYSTIGPYQHGVWLVSHADGSNPRIVDHSHLPTGSQWRYYWLGATSSQAASRINGALSALGVNTDPLKIPVSAPSQFHISKISSGDPLGLAGPIPGVVSGEAKGVGQAITSVADFLSFIAWIFHPHNFLRAAEFVVGIITMFYGLHMLIRLGIRSRSSHRTTVRSLATALFPEARAARAGRRAGRVQGTRDYHYREQRRATHEQHRANAESTA